MSAELSAKLSAKLYTGLDGRIEELVEDEYVLRVYCSIIFTHRHCCAAITAITAISSDAKHDVPSSLVGTV
jgi:hypothetical protein